MTVKSMVSIRAEPIMYSVFVSAGYLSIRRYPLSAEKIAPIPNIQFTYEFFRDNNFFFENQTRIIKYIGEMIWSVLESFSLVKNEIQIKTKKKLFIFYMAKKISTDIRYRSGIR